ncbi:MAG: hypothetical protein SGBAC_005088 [Bacillariaceae sp.]
MHEYNTAETPRGGRRRKSLLSTMKRSNSKGNLMDDVDGVKDVSESAGSDSDLIFFQQAHEEAKSAGKRPRRNSLLLKFKRSSSTGNLMEDGCESAGSDSDLLMFQSAKANAISNTAETPRGRGRRKVGSLIRTLKRSTSKSRLNDADIGVDDDLRQIQKLEDIERAILSSTPRSAKKKQRLRNRLKAKEGIEPSGLNADSHHSTKSGRVSRRMSKSPGRLSKDYSVRDPEKQEKKMSRETSDRDTVPLPNEQTVQQKERQESLTTPRLKKKKSKSKLQVAALDLQSPVEKKYIKRPGRSKSTNDCLTTDNITVATNDMTIDASPGASERNEEHGYESEGRMGRKKRVPRPRRNRAPVKEVLVRPKSPSPHQAKRQSILKDLEGFEDRESVTNMYLNRQVEALKRKVKSLSKENESIQDQLNSEIDQNGRMALKLREHELGLAALESVNHTKVTVEVLKKDHQTEKDEMELLLKEKDMFIAKLQRKIESVRVANDTMQLQRESSRKSLESVCDNVEDLRNAVENQRTEIHDLATNLFVANEQREEDKRYINDLQGELQQTKDDKNKLVAEMRETMKQHKINMKRKDETVSFLQEALSQLKLKESKQRDKERERAASPFGLRAHSPRSKSPGSQLFTRSPGRMSFRNLREKAASLDLDDPRSQSASDLGYYDC